MVGETLYSRPGSGKSAAVLASHLKVLNLPVGASWDGVCAVD